ncbi:MAG: 2OG-Fe(II) oxygenase family protein [Woeseiaceae bacterium]|nr:2OG-Fe(II) oxygenase family protein [Woeseiaceae bacterium]
MTYHLAAALDGARLRDDFERQGFVQVQNVLAQESARRVHKALAEHQQWNLVFNQDSKHFDLDDAEIRKLPGHDFARLQAAIHAQAREHFQYLYNNYPIFDAHRAGLNAGSPLHAFYEWLNSAEFLDFARAVTGQDAITFADAKATRYMPGHFLTEHDDSQEGKNRLAAYIFNFTERWRPDWGGYLQLLSDNGDIRHGMMPAFNALNIIDIPQRHSVSYVAPFAGTARLSITGWLRSGSPD